MDPPSPAILVTGGLPGEANLTCEVLRGDGSHWCSLPDLGQARHGHTQTGLVACGGEGALFSCSTFAQSAWHTSHSLPRPRTHHSAWSPAPAPAPGPVLLLGGETSASGLSTALLPQWGEAEQHFPLQYNTV